jgi:hypothetical protein
LSLFFSVKKAFQKTKIYIDPRLSAIISQTLEGEGGSKSVF